MNTNLKLAKLFYKYEKKEENETENNKNETDKKIKEQKPKETETVSENASYPPYNFSWFVENKIAAMGLPQTVENLNYLAKVGVNHLITLSPERLPPILECKKKMKWSEIRVKEFSAPTLKQIIKFIEICQRAEIRGEVSTYLIYDYRPQNNVFSFIQCLIGGNK